MAYVSIPDETKELMDMVMADIKGDYVTQKLFLDSAIRSKLRSMRIEAGDDLIIAHLERLQKSKARHLEKQSIAITKARHAKRVAVAKRRLNQGV